MSRAFSLGLLAGCMLILGCDEREVILEGERFDVRAPLSESLEPADATAAQETPEQPVTAAPPINLPATVNHSSWTHRNGSPQHRIQHPALGRQLTLVWAAPIGEGESRRHRITAEPVADAGRIFTLDSRARVSAHSTAGAPIWSRNLTPPSDSDDDASGGGLTVSGNTLYVTTGFGAVYALDVATGNERWVQRLGAPAGAPVTVSGGLVYLVSRDSVAWAIDAENGRVRWSLPGSGSTSGLVGGAAPAMTDRLVVFPYPSGDLAGALKQSGVRVWGDALSGVRRGNAYTGFVDIKGDPVVVGQTIYAGSAVGRVVALNARSGERIWTAAEGAYGPVWPAGGSIFLLTDQSELVRLNDRTGETLWKVQLPFFTDDRERRRKEGIYAHYGPILAGGRLIVASEDEVLRGYDPENGVLIETVEMPGPAASAPIVVGGTLYVVSADGELLAYR